MTETELRKKVLEQAKSWIGCSERDGSHMKVINEYNKIQPLPRNYKMQSYDPWCAAFVSAVGHAVGLSDIIFPECGCGPMIELYKKAGRWMEADDYEPKSGDVIFYDWNDTGVGDCTGEPDHVGLVWACYKGDITIVEGNCSNCVCYQYRHVNDRYIRGYGLPDYESKADEKEPEVVIIEDDQPAEKECTVTLPILMIGDDGDAVRAMQYLLEKRGFKCGWTGADGEFGRMTESALGKFQRAYDVEVDGICKGADWYVLIVGVKKHG